MKLRLAKGITLDLDDEQVRADGLRVWIGGEPGSGKSNAAMLLVAQTVEQDGQVVVLDAHGEYGPLWGLRPGGRRAIIRYGYGTEPVHEGSVELCLQNIREGHSLLLDLSHWTDLEPGKLDLFVRELLRGLYQERRAHPKPTLVLVEEAHTFAPQQQAKDQAENVRIFTAMLTGGRKFGLNFVLSSQRPSMVDSNVVSACNVRLFMRISEVGDWKKRVQPYLPKGFPLGFASVESKQDIKKFASGEALVMARWFELQRVRLDRATVLPSLAQAG